MLALISSGLGVALASSTAGQVLEHIHFSRLSTGRVLAVLVTQAGAVQDRVLALDRDLTPHRTGDGRALPERELSRLAHRAHSRRGGAARGAGAGGLPPDAGLGRGTLPQGRSGRRRGRSGHLCGRNGQPDRRRGGPRAPAPDAAGPGGQAAAGGAADRLRGRTSAGGARGGGAGWRLRRPCRTWC